jgi:hypothetical protein
MNNRVGKELRIMDCPVCGSSVIGKIGNNQYYCWECCSEFSQKENGVKVFSILDDGSLIAMEEGYLQN